MWRGLLFLTLLASPTLGAAVAQDTAVAPYGVGVNGNDGIYLGNGLVLSVAHVVGGGIVDKPTVRIAGQKLTATVIKESPFEQLDLALLQFNESTLPVTLRLRRLALCQGKPWPKEAVISLVGQTPVRSYVISPMALPPHVRNFSTVIRDVATTGNSGTGLFDADRKCLLGIMSRKISEVRLKKDTGEKTTVDIAKYFVPASVIAGFMPARYQLAPESGPPIQFSSNQ